MDAIAAAARRTLLERRATLARLAQEMETPAQDLRAAQLREVEAALGRIDDGTYGRCESCQGAIGRLRLRAIPEVRLCVGCSSRRV